MVRKRPITGAVLTVVLLICIFFTGGYVFPAAEAIWLTIPVGSGFKCVSEEIQSDIVVVADYFSVDQSAVELAPNVDVLVTSPFGNKIYDVKNMSHGQFGFTAAEVGTYTACFTVDAGKQKNPVILSLDWRTGIKAKDWDSIAKKEKLEGIELDLRRHKETVEAIMRNLLYISIREASMRNLNEATNKRVAQLSIMSMLVCIVVSLVHVWHLKRFFLKKKLI